MAGAGADTDLPNVVCCSYEQHIKDDVALETVSCVESSMMTSKQALSLLKLCDKLSCGQLMELGAYLIACAYHKCKPTQGTEG